ncbi:50S ribosomal protein L30 [Armatimonadota bacterium]|nr:50S ribosomal protein L30 [Armatimonadota bacterium]GDX39955.1 50S ribosomal protein L30 [Armatimonadota bacterium]
MAVKLKITLRHSAIGYSQRHKDTVRTLGFKKLHQSVVREDSRALRGMLHKINHLIAVETVNEE